jgi:hypothetical protein
LLSLIGHYACEAPYRFVFDKFIAKGGEYGHKVVVELFANWWLREET